MDAIRQAGGLAQINHPNYKWAFDHEAIRQVRGAHFVEIYNGASSSNNDGGGGMPSMDEIWDKVLSSGLLIFGVAADDSHEYKWEYEEFCGSRGKPGMGWIVVRAAERSVVVLEEFAKELAAILLVKSDVLCQSVHR